jgi:tetratricopeptide (TPR) repeat protein
MIPRRIPLAVVLIAAMTSALAAQRLADPQSRREALQFYRIGQEFFTSEKFDRAAEEFSKATAKDPLFTLAHYQAGQSYMNLKRYASAIQAFQRCIESTRSLYGLAETNRFAVEKQRDDEVREMRETVKVLQQSGHQLLAMRAEQHLLDLDEVNSKLGEAHNNLAVVYLQTGRVAEAEAAIKTAEKAGFRVNPQLKDDIKNASRRD